MQICKFNLAIPASIGSVDKPQENIYGDGLVFVNPAHIIQINTYQGTTLLTTTGQEPDSPLRITQSLEQAVNQWQNCLQGIN